MKTKLASDPYWPEDALAKQDIAKQFYLLYSRIAPRADATIEERAGQLMASAVFHGGLLSRQTWKRWLEAATTTAWLDQDLAWVEIAPTDPEGFGPDTQTRRWFADSVTRLLLAHWHTDGLHLRMRKCDPSACLRAFFGSSEECLEDALWEHSVKHWQLRIPPVVVGHALDFHRAVPAGTEDWQRVLGFGRKIKPKKNKAKDQAQDEESEPTSAAPPRQKKNKAKDQAQDEESEPTSAAPPRQRRKRADDAELSEIFRILKKYQGPKNFKKAAANEISSLSTSSKANSQWKAVKHWCVFALKNGQGRHSPGFEPSTLIGYLAKLVSEVFRPSDRPETWTQFDLEIRYEESLEAIDLGSRRNNTHNAICSFHKYLRSQNSTLDELPQEFSRFRAEDRSAVNLLSPEEYQRALEKCHTRELRLILTLSFRAGLRLPETLGLWIADFHFYDNDKCDLVVAKNSDRRLKTQDSRRILPLDLLLDRHEFADLRTWVDDRRALAVPSRATGFMFGHINGENSLRERDVKGPLGKVLHHVTGTALTVHHLRHSFASYLQTTLLLPDDDRCVRIPDQLTPVISYERKRALADRLLGSQKLGQHSVHALSESMGHIVSSTTLRTYSHLLDLTLCHYVSQPSVEAMLPAEEVRKLTGQNRPTATTPVVTASTEVTGYQRPPYPTAPLDGVKPGNFQVSQVRGRRASRIERSLRASKLTLKRVRAWTGKPVASTPPGPDWREIVFSYSRHNSDLPNERWRASAEALKELKEKSGKSRHLAGLQVSGSARWLKLVDHHWQPHLRLNKEQRKVLFRVIEKWNCSKGGVLFSSRPMAVVWRDILRKLEFQESQVRISLTGKRFENRSSEILHRELATADDLPGTSAKRLWRGSILIRFFDEPGNSRHLKSAGQFIILMLAIKEGYGLAKGEI